MSGKKEITLLPEEADNSSISARVIRYLTTIGRYIIVFTEAIVIMAFLSRFWFDRQNSDLSDTLRQQKAILQSTTEFEKEYLSLQDRLKYIGAHYSAQTDYEKNIKSIVSSLPTDVYLSNFTINNEGAQLSLFSYQEDSLVNAIINLSLNPQISNVDIRKIEKKSKDSKYYLDISLKFKQNSAKPTI